VTPIWRKPSIDSDPTDSVIDVRSIETGPELTWSGGGRFPSRLSPHAKIAHAAIANTDKSPRGCTART
jgi:hypothetical protein